MDVPVVTGVAVASPATPMAQGPPPLSPAARAALKARGFPPGLCETVHASLSTFPVRIWVVDNSGSMNASDGKRLATDRSGSSKMVACTRWQELVDTVRSIASLSLTLNARTDFHLLNAASGVKHISVGASTSSAALIPSLGVTGGAAEVERLIGTSPTGSTPLTEAVTDIIGMIEPAADKLRAHGESVVVVLATDGKPNNESTFIAALRRLQALPVWVVVRLCTNDDAMTSYWSELDKMLESPLEVLDDLAGEAEEITAANPWLCYGQPLHQAREFGAHDKILDLLDEQKLIGSQVKSFCELLLSGKAAPLPEPDLDQPAFDRAVEEHLRECAPVFDPIRGKASPWIKLDKLGGKAKGGCAIA